VIVSGGGRGWHLRCCRWPVWPHRAGDLEHPGGRV